MPDEPKMQDSGERRTFASGAVRDRGGFKPRPDLISPHANLREGAWMAKGAEKYGLRNYEKGMPISECIASLNRHLEQYKLGDDSEDHLAAIRTNASFVIHFEEEIKAGRMSPEFADMPHYKQRACYMGQRIFWSDDPDNPKRETESIASSMLNGPTGVMAPDPPIPQQLADCMKCNPCSQAETEYMSNVAEAKISAEASASLAAITAMAPATGEWTERPTFYIAGPMRGYDQYNFPAFDAARDRGVAMGYNIISPADMDRDHGFDPTKPDCREWTAKGMRDVVRRDIDAIFALGKSYETSGGGIAVLPGWVSSTGARAEVAVAEWLGLPVVSAADFTGTII